MGKAKPAGVFQQALEEEPVVHEAKERVKATAEKLQDVEALVDWAGLICQLCRRKFKVRGQGLPT